MWTFVHNVIQCYRLPSAFNDASVTEFTNENNLISCFIDT